jgi:hypothetical protein
MHEDDDPKHISTLLPAAPKDVAPLIWEKLRWATEQRLTRDYRTVSFGEQECRWLLNLLESSKEQKELAKEPRNAR